MSTKKSFTKTISTRWMMIISRSLKMITHPFVHKRRQQSSLSMTDAHVCSEGAGRGSATHCAPSCGLCVVSPALPKHTISLSSAYGMLQSTLITSPAPLGHAIVLSQPTLSIHNRLFTRMVKRLRLMKRLRL